MLLSLAFFSLTRGNNLDYLLVRLVQTRTGISYLSGKASVTASSSNSDEDSCPKSNYSFCFWKMDLFAWMILNLLSIARQGFPILLSSLNTLPSFKTEMLWVFYRCFKAGKLLKMHPFLTMKSGMVSLIESVISSSPVLNCSSFLKLRMRPGATNELGTLWILPVSFSSETWMPWVPAKQTI